MKVPYLDLTRQYETIKDELNEAVIRCLRGGHYILGEEVARFEEEVSRYLGVKHAIGVSSGTDALKIALRALGIARGDLVLTVPFTFFATVEAICHTGAWPLFVDVDPETFNMDPDVLNKTLSKKKDVKERIKAILPVHLFGLMADMKPILEIARRHKLVVVEDAAQALGARRHGDYAGTVGTLGCYSFFPSKNLGGAGDGGLIVTNDDKLAERCRLLRVHAATAKNIHDDIGYTARLDALQAAILRVKLKHLEKWNEARRENAAFYNKELGRNGSVKVPVEPKGAHHIYNQYTIRVNAKQRDSLREFLNRNGVPTEIYYPLPAHLQKPLAHLGYRRGDLPGAEQCAAECLSLPVFPELTDAERKHIVASVRRFFEVPVGANQTK